jgi:hypothetical protein
VLRAPVAFIPPRGALGKGPKAIYHLHSRTHAEERARKSTRLLLLLLDAIYILLPPPP